MMKRWWMIAVMLTLVITGAAVAPAQGQELVEYTLNFDFTVDDGGWVAGPPAYGVDGLDANYNPGIGWNTVRRSEVETVNADAGRRNFGLITYTFDQPVDLTYVDFTYAFGSGATSQHRSFDLYLDGSQVLSYNQSVPVSVSRTVDRITIYIAYSDAYDPNHSPRGVISAAELRYLDYAQPEEFVRPLTTDNIGPASILQSPETTPSPVTYAYSNVPGDPVHVAVDGIVSEVRTARQSDCEADLGITKTIEYKLLIYINTCIIGSVDYEYEDILSDIGNSAQNLFSYWIAPYDLNPLNAIGWWGGSLNADLVTILDNEGRVWKYWVENAINYVEPGVQVSAGCVLGETLQLSRVDFNTLISFGVFGGDILNVTNPSNQGFTAVVMPPELTGDELIPPNGLEPSLGECNKPAEFAGCIDGISTKFVGSWDADRAYFQQNGIVRMEAGGSISMQVNIDVERAPELHVAWRPAFGIAGVVVAQEVGINLNGGLGTARFGTGYQTSQLTNPTSATYQQDRIDLSNANPDLAGGFYTFSLESYDVALEIQYVCLAFQEDEEGNELPPAPPGSCYFQDASFNEDGTAWTTSSASVTFKDGKAELPSGEWVGQDVRLFPKYDETNAIQTYKVTVVASLEDLSASGIYGLTDTTVTFDFEWGTFTAEDFAFPKVVNILQFQQENNYVEFSFNFAPLSEVDAPFKVRATIANPGTDTYAVSIHSLCIEGNFPGYREDIPDDDGPFPEECSIVSKPTGNQLGQWTQYHWLQMNRFFQCDLMVTLNDWYENSMDFMTTVKWFFRWLLALFQSTLDWLSTDVLFWLNGHLANIAGGQTTFIEIETGPESCNNLFCLFDTLIGGVGNVLDTFIQALADVLVSSLEEVFGPVVQVLAQIVGGAFDVLFDLIKKIIDLLFNVIYAIFDLEKTAGESFGHVVEDIREAEPAEIPVIPQCGIAPESNIVCRGFWAIDNTFLTGPGEILPGLITGYMVVMMVIWFVKRAKEIMLEANGAI